jgi:ribosomal protein S30
LDKIITSMSTSKKCFIVNILTLWEIYREKKGYWSKLGQKAVPGLIPKGLLSLQGTIGSLGSVTWCHFFKRFFETFCEHAPQNKLHEITNFIIFGPIDQKLWRNKKIKRSLGRASKCWSQPPRIDHMCKKMYAWRRRGILQGTRGAHYMCIYHTTCVQGVSSGGVLLFFLAI